jgi:hypothetical protein
MQMPTASSFPKRPTSNVNASQVSMERELNAQVCYFIDGTAKDVLTIFTVFQICATVSVKIQDSASRTLRAHRRAAAEAPSQGQSAQSDQSLHILRAALQPQLFLSYSSSY